MAVPTILPTEAVPLDIGKKRRYSEVVDLTGERHTTATGDQHSPATTRDSEPRPLKVPPQRDLEDDEFDYEDSSDEELEDFMDDAELNPWADITDGGPFSMSSDTIAAYKMQLRGVGPEEFFDEAINNHGLSPRRLGVVFGINPLLHVTDDTYLRLLSLAIVRFYHKRSKLAQYNTIEDAAKLLQSSRNIMVITGAGISTSLGIPDFRSKGTGFYDKVREMGYSEPEEVFNIDNFDTNPEIFYRLAGDILPDQKRYSPTHGFIRLLQDHNRLQTNYTQNIDNLEELAGIERDRIIQCHGSFATASCRKCKHQVKGTEIFADIRAKQVAQCKRCLEAIRSSKLALPPQKRSKSKNRNSSADSDADDDIAQAGIMKPDITFFGEALPNTFFETFTQRDAQETDLVIVIGTSLKVAPVSEMPNFLPKAVPHIYISRETIKHVEFDIQLLGNCDDVVYELCRRAGWDLKHEMIPTTTGYTMDVKPLLEFSHISTIAPRKPEIAESDESDESDDEDVRDLEPVPIRSSPQKTKTSNSNSVFRMLNGDFTPTP
ncbi:hypothetical protein DOTSEDRAFT_68672 [Dothistroma septosporum NZE10]|uniref:Deacetylase sirtuin-type domain-containing protein n=1 Tax=Dothistroma septosporum (strain NZE10 / CBS 128990) TaxID=675120 RepID=N1Q3W7_DOTSN|nr:hypothetical protein DOTSEDRAFT_68672 [Dothistroma septosporum NZE10]